MKKIDLALGMLLVTHSTAFDDAVALNSGNVKWDGAHPYSRNGPIS